MLHEIRGWIFAGLLAAIPLAVGAAAFRVALEIGCAIRWSDSAMEYRVNFFTCQVQHPVMGWIPEDRIRGD